MSSLCMETPARHGVGDDSSDGDVVSPPKTRAVIEEVSALRPPKRRRLLIVGSKAHSQHLLDIIDCYNGLFGQHSSVDADSQGIGVD